MIVAFLEAALLGGLIVAQTEIMLAPWFRS
jgi:hypothetical protein